MNRRAAIAATTSAVLLGAADAVSGHDFPGQEAAGNAVHGLRTFGGIGKERTILEAGKEVELFRHAGTGCLTHM